MSRQWKPGDVAFRTGMNGATDISLVIKPDRYGFCADEHVRGPHWHHANGGWNELDDDEKFGTYRPLVVIDPEDREQVEDLCRRYVETYGARWDGREKPVINMQSALRSLAEPEPEEPTGLGAVVRDGDGSRWVRTDDQIVTSHRNPWVRWNATATGGDKRHWSGLPRPLTVLSDGYTEDGDR